MLLATLARLRTGWWLVACIALGLWRRIPDASATLLTGSGGFSSDGSHRAHVFGFWATVLGLALIVLAASLGHETSTRDRAWLGPRPCSRGRVAARQIGGLFVACLALALALALSSELRLSGGAAPRVLHAELPAGSTELVRLAPGATATLDLPNLDQTPLMLSGDATPTAAAGLTLHLSVAPSAAGVGSRGGLALERIAAPTLRTLEGGPQTFEVGSARVLNVDLAGHAGGPLELSLPTTGAGLRYVPSASWVSTPAASAHYASAALGLHWLLLTLAFSGLAFGLAHHMRRTPAAALAASVPLANLLFGDPLALDGFGRSLRFAVEGVVPQLPPAGALVTAATVLATAWLLASLRPIQEVR